MATYTSMRGVQVDMARLFNQNENVRSVGNMNVTARGDEIPPRIITSDPVKHVPDHIFQPQVQQVKSAPAPVQILDKPISDIKETTDTLDAILSKKPSKASKQETATV